ncbi:MAG: ankyrin repeat domain-containing protein [bacterium]
MKKLFISLGLVFFPSILCGMKPQLDTLLEALKIKGNQCYVIINPELLEKYEKQIVRNIKKHGIKKVVEYLIDNKILKELQHPFHFNQNIALFFQAIRDQNIQEVANLFKKINLNINNIIRSDNGESALIYAIRQGFLDAVQFFLEKGAKIQKDYLITEHKIQYKYNAFYAIKLTEMEYKKRYPIFKKSYGKTKEFKNFFQKKFDDINKIKALLGVKTNFSVTRNKSVPLMKFIHKKQPDQELLTQSKKTDPVSKKNPNPEDLSELSDLDTWELLE